MKQKEAKKTKRSNRTREEQDSDKLNKKENMKDRRDNPTSYYIARHAQNILYGKQIVKELIFTDDSIGSMDEKCTKCMAIKWKAESNTTCCNNGKVELEKFPDPPSLLKTLWKADTPEARLFRENSRSFNNALALASLKVNERKFRGSS